jgi:hypothetical protein
MFENSRVEDMLEIMFSQILTTQYTEGFTERMLLPYISDC